MGKRIYELTYWLKISSDIESEETKILNLIKKDDGEILDRYIPRKRRLAYPIMDEYIGYLGTIYFSFLPEKIENLKNDLKKFQSILRFIIVKRTQLQTSQKIKEEVRA